MKGNGGEGRGKGCVGWGGEKGEGMERREGGGKGEGKKAEGVGNKRGGGKREGGERGKTVGGEMGE